MPKSHAWWPLVRTLIIAISAGAASGVVAAVAMNRSLDSYATYLLERYRAPDVTVEKPSPIPGTYEEALDRVRSSAISVAYFTSPTSDSAQVGELINHDDVLGLGAVVSADGWIVTTKTATQSMNTTTMDVWVDGVRYDVTSVVDDALTDVRLIKISGNDLASLGFGDSFDIDAGEMVFGLSQGGAVDVVEVVASDALVTPGAHEAEVITVAWRLASAPGPVPLVNAVGDFVGFASSDEAALPLHHALAFVQGVIRSGSGAHAGLGAYVVDLASVLNVSDDLSQGAEAGALILAPSVEERAIVRGGPAAEAGLAVRDIILAIDGESITSTSTLAEYLATYSPGQSARLTVLRGGETITVTVTFGKANDLIY